MAARKGSSLRVVAPGEKPVERKLLSVTDAAANGDRLDLLLSMQARVATAVQDPNTPARDLAALTRRLMEIAKDIEAIRLAMKQEGADGGPVEDQAFDASAI
jgi:hypothetical protein